MTTHEGSDVFKNTGRLCYSESGGLSIIVISSKLYMEFSIKGKPLHEIPNFRSFDSMIINGDSNEKRTRLTVIY